VAENALKYRGEDLSEIRIGYGEDETCHILTLRDNGVGIEEEDEEHLFELFQRHEKSRGTEGSGLGLAIVKAIAERHGGKVWLQSGEGKGANFCFSIPKNTCKSSTIN
jgi:signal transduction histidine kinase